MRKIIKISSDSGLFDILHHTNNLMGRMYFHGGHVSPGQERILELLAEKGRINQRELLDILPMRPGSLSEILAKIEAKGLIEREKDESDKRSVIVHLTEPGQAEAEKMKRINTERENEFFSCLSAEEKEMLKGSLVKLIFAWEDKLRNMPELYEGYGEGASYQKGKSGEFFHGRHHGPRGYKGNENENE